MLARFLKYVLQSVAGMIGISIYILADTFFIAKYSGADGLAVLNLMIPIYGLMFAIGAMIGIGSATWFSIKGAMGEDRSGYFAQSIGWSFVCSIPFILAGIFIPGQVLTLMGADQTLIALGIDYMRVVLIFSPFFIINYSFTAFVRNDKAPTIAMIGSICGSAFNIVFDYIFMFMMDMGMLGAALATAASPGITMLVCSLHLRSKENNIVFKWNRLTVQQLLLSSKLGIPAFVGEIAGGVTTLTFNMLILGVAGNIGVAAYGVIANIAIVVIAIFNGIAQGMQPLASDSYGRKDEKETKGFLKLALITGLLTAGIIILTSWVFTAPMVNVFNSEGNTVLFDYAFTGMRIYFIGFVFAAVNIIFVTYFAAVNRPKPAFVCSVSRGVVAIVLCAIILAKLMGMTGIWMSFAVAEAITFLIIIAANKGKRG